MSDGRLAFFCNRTTSYIYKPLKSYDLLVFLSILFNAIGFSNNFGYPTIHSV